MWYNLLIAHIHKSVPTWHQLCWVILTQELMFPLWMQANLTKELQNWPNLTKEIYKIIIPRLVFLRISPQSCKKLQHWRNLTIEIYKLLFVVWFFFGFLLRAAQNMSSFTSLVYAVLLVVLLALSAEAFGFFEYGYPSFNPSPFFYPYYRGYADDFFDDD